jgi:Ran GTPase-activating protein (RanGAP) involved in mRNA processing and transport
VPYAIAELFSISSNIGKALTQGMEMVFVDVGDELYIKTGHIWGAKSVLSLGNEGFAPAFIEFKPHKLPQIAEGFMASSSLVQEAVAQSLGAVPLEENLKRQVNVVEEEINTSPTPVETLEEMDGEEAEEEREGDNEWLEDEEEETNEDDEDVIAEDSDKNSQAEPALAIAGDVGRQTTNKFKL